MDNSGIAIIYKKKNRAKLDTSHVLFDVIREHFSFHNDEATFSSSGNIPKRVYVIGKNGEFETGNLLEIKNYIIKEHQIDVNISQRVKDDLIRTIQADIKTVPELDNPDTFLKERDYQPLSIKKALKLGRGVFDIGTGGGKTYIMATLLESIYAIDPDFKCMLVVPNISLKNQTYSDFKAYKCSFTYDKWDSSGIDESCNVYIVNTGFLQKDREGEVEKTINGKIKAVKRKISKYQDIKHIIKDIKILIYDEVHLFHNKKSNKSSTLLRRIDYDHLFGFTGSLNTKTFSKYKIVGFFGPVIFNKTTKELRDEGYLAEAEIKMMKFHHQNPHEIYTFEKGQDKLKNYTSECNHVFESEFRNRKIEKLVGKLNGNVLILVERIRQGELLQEICESIPNRTVYFINGDMSVDERDRIKQELEDNDDIICIAMSKIFHIGISINNIPYLIFSYLGKAWAKTVQSVGRGLRLHENKDKLVIFDLYDNLIYSEDHANQRMELYYEQQIEFKEHDIYE